jgi:hypothetical protein
MSRTAINTQSANEESWLKIPGSPITVFRKQGTCWQWHCHALALAYTGMNGIASLCLMFELPESILPMSFEARSRSLWGNQTYAQV